MEPFLWKVRTAAGDNRAISAVFFAQEDQNRWILFLSIAEANQNLCVEKEI